ncbi:MAG: hypothetical protein DRR16_22335 [Candidatus Parabeggiatoa sp. nov. 3]|nr:MAG: hypothetical protein DRR00_20365 [Gammaproteobacteria bacterium]RKZ63298.1 MAG: hypothetical protein DRQ99_17370 [Gammaproteobacteria bacterium]RKZ81321.1 MAG: hypothetical protein DRR16_22335 [Gammaproteobacteria bacterium]
MRLLFISQTLCLFCYLLTTALVYAETTVVDPAQTAFDKGQFEEAIFLWQKVFAENSQKTPLNIQIKLASAYQKLGFYQKAFNLLQASLTQAKTQKNNQAHQAIILSEIGVLYLSGYQDKKSQDTILENEDNYEKVIHYFEKAIEIALQTNDKLVIAKVLNKQGNLLFIEGNYEDAIITYKESEQLAREAGDLSLVSKVLINMTNTMILEDEVKVTVVKQLRKALYATQKLKASHDKSFGLMALSNLISSEIPDEFMSKSAKGWFQYTALKSAQKSAEITEDSRAKSYAYGYMGKLYEDEKRYKEALQLTRQAVFFALETALPELMYRWYWQWGRVLKAQGQKIRAIKMYQSAIDSIRATNIIDCNRSIIPRLLQTGYRNHDDNFYKTLGKLYFELADLLIEEGDLQRALDTVEYFKIVEFQYYFKDDCIVEKKPIKHFKLPIDTAILYPILLPDRIELLLKLPRDYIKRFVVSLQYDKKAETVDGRVNDKASYFNTQLRHKNTDEYKEVAQELYQWLIAPIEISLNQHQITTLVVVPDRQLRTIPFAALHDGEKFLIQKYAIAILPSLKLSYPKALSRQSVQVFIGGISVPVRIPNANGNAKKSIKLPSVPEALKRIQALYPQNSKKFLDAKLTKSIFEKEMESPLAYTIVHIASHSYFALEPEDSYLLLYQEYLTMDRLEELLKYGRFKKQPVELLTLSACETAKGDDHKAGLGLAGLSIKAGVESTLANLWLVDDRAATELSVAFYKHLQEQKLTKAQALQKAQQELMEIEKFQHPYYWAPLILIGNWH